MRRREFITLLGGAAAAWPAAARAQQPAVHVIGYLYSGAAETSAPLVAAFRKGLNEAGFFEGRNVEIEYRWANNEPERLPGLATDLVRRRVAVIVSPGIAEAALAAKAATATIPIIFRTGGDPVALGLVDSLNRPGSNVTGVNAMSQETGTKRLGLLHELLPAAQRFTVLANTSDPSAERSIKELRAAAFALGRQIEIVGANSNHEIDVAFAGFAQTRPEALLVDCQGLFINRRLQIVTHATRHALPAIYCTHEWAEIGGLMSYGASATDQFRLTGVYTGRVLKGEKPADLPVLRASKFDLVINLQTAKVFGIDIPPTLIARADEVIE
jgi:putative tryptophan/tyrosine transport system substrate-binding protein